MPYLNFYRDYFSQGKPAHVPLNYLSLEEAIALIVRSGGVPVLAHPGDTFRNRLELIDQMIPLGIQGIEAFSTYHSESQCQFFSDKAKEFGLFTTGGSDYHGKNKPTISIGNYPQMTGLCEV